LSVYWSTLQRHNTENLKQILPEKRNCAASVPMSTVMLIVSCSVQTRTGIGLLGKPPAVKQFPPLKAKRRMRFLRDPRANAGMKRTSVVEHNLYFAGLAID
jgi:hypothetical protein